MQVSCRNLGQSARYVFLSAIACAMLACTGPELAPLWQLEQGCHVWFDDGSGHGVSSSIGGAVSSIEIGERSLDGPELVGGGDIAFQDKTFAHFDGSTLAIEALGILTAEYSGAVERTAGTIHLEGGQRSIDLQRSKSCTPPQAALGAAAVYLALFESDRQARIHSHVSSP